MNRATFDIIPQEGLDNQLEHSTLLMEIGENFFRYIVYDKQTHKILGLRQYHFDVSPEKPALESLSEILQNDNHLNQPAKETVLIYNYCDSCLWPERYFHVETNKPIIELVYGNAHKGLILCDKVKGWELYSVYRVPREIHSLFQQKFSSGRYWHFYTLWLTQQEKTTVNTPAIHSIFYSDKFIVTVFDQTGVVLMQSYSYQTPEDVVYYLLSICKNFDIHPDKVPLHLSGLMDKDSALFKELYKYFLFVEYANMPQSVHTNGLFADIPSHYFSPIMKLALCV